MDRCLADGRRSGLAAAAHAGKNCAAPEPLSPNSAGVTYPNPVFPHPKGKDFVEFDEDVQVKDILDAAAMGWDHIQLLKRFSTAGMGPSQGKLYNALVQKVLSGATATPSPKVGTVTIRPPVFGEKLGHLAGRAFEPVRLTAMHHRHLAAGARMMPAGTWMRPAFYGKDMESAVRAEVLAARQGVGLIDVSTLGGLDIRGPDAARFLERIYTVDLRKARRWTGPLCADAGRDRRHHRRRRRRPPARTPFLRHCHHKRRGPRLPSDAVL